MSIQLTLAIYSVVLSSVEGMTLCHMGYIVDNLIHIDLFHPAPAVKSGHRGFTLDLLWDTREACVGGGDIKWE